MEFRMEVSKIFAERANQRRKELRLTQEALAKRLGITRGTVGGYLQGNTVPGSEVLLDWAQALETSPEFLLGQDLVDRKEEDPNELRLALVTAILLAKPNQLATIRDAVPDDLIEAAADQRKRASAV